VHWHPGDLCATTEPETDPLGFSKVLRQNIAGKHQQAFQVSGRDENTGGCL